MNVLKDFPEDFAKALQTSFYMLQIFNVRYLEDDQPFFKKNWRFSYISATVLIHIVSLALYIPEVLTREMMSQFAYLIPSILVTIHATLKCLVLIPNTRDVSAFVKELGSLWRVKFTPSQKQEKDTLLWQLNFINRVSFWISVIGSFQYLLSPLFETLFRRFILKQDFDLLLPFGSKYPFDPTKNWLIYIVVYIFQLYSMTLLVGMYMGAALIMTTSCALLGIEFLMIKHDLDQVEPRPNREKGYVVDADGNDRPSIEMFVERHQKLLRLSRQLDNVFTGMVFIDVLFVGITTCAFSVMGQYARGPGYMLVSYIGIASSMLTVLYLCYYGELLSSASTSIGDAAYDNLWYKGGKQYKMAILFIIKISQKPCCLTSLRHVVVSMTMFTKVISTTWSYFSLMNSVYSEEQ
uniref:Odorant receptor n=1 Tax=Mythimna separata TaxID=271217 RepID=A0A7H1DHA4_MYTSE|nr:olfactory receptor 40 [Mythimna separata]